MPKMKHAGYLVSGNAETVKVKKMISTIMPETLAQQLDFYSHKTGVSIAEITIQGISKLLKADALFQEDLKGEDFKKFIAPKGQTSLLIPKKDK